MKVHNNSKFYERRKDLRRNATPEEEILWQQLRNSNLGARFRRQHSIGGYILDFYCFPARLIIEIDGKSHDGKYDQVRDKYFADLEYLTLRIKNIDVHTDSNEVINRIRNTLSLRLGEGGVAG